MKTTKRASNKAGKTSLKPQPQNGIIRPKGMLKTLHRAIQAQCRKESLRSEKEWKERIKREFTLPAQGLNPCCIAIYNRDSRELISRVPLTEDEFQKLWDSGNKDGVLNRTAAEQFIAGAIRAQLTNPGRGMDEQNALEGAAEHVNSLLELLTNNLESLKDIGTMNERELTRFVSGVRIIAQIAQDALQDAVRGMGYVITNRPALETATA